MRKMKKIVALVTGILVLGVTPLTLVGCGSGGGAEEPVQFFIADDQGGAVAAMVERYNKETEGNVELVEIPYSDFDTRISNMIQAGEFPGIVRHPGVDYTWRDHLLDLTDVANSNGVRYDLSVRDENDDIRALAFDLTVVGMFINTTLFEAAGVDWPETEEDIWRWDEFLDALDTVIDNSDARYGLVIDGSDHRLRAFVYQHGGMGFFTEDGGETYTTDAATIAAMERFVELNDDRMIPRSVWLTGESAASMFGSGQVAAHMSGSWQVQDYSETIGDFEWRPIYMPYQEVRGTNLGGNFIAAFEGSGQEEGALAFLNWLYTPENYADLMVLGGYLPVIEDLEIPYDEAIKEMFDVFVKEMEAAGPISSEQMISGTTRALYGQRGLTGVWRDAMVRLLNDEITMETLLEEVTEDYRQADEVSE